VTAQSALADPTLVRSVARVVAYALASTATAAAAAVVYRWYTRDRIPPGLTALLGVAVVSVYLNTVGMFGDIVGGDGGGLFELRTVVFNVVALGVALAATPVGRVVGDRVATDVFAVAGARELDVEVSRLVRTVGRVTAVTLPEEIDDIDGYDPVPEATKADLAGRTLLFPRRLTVAELRDRLATRLTEDHGVGRVDADLDDGGDVTRLAVGRRLAGVGPTLASGTCAVALRADPAPGATPGDVVQVWTAGEEATPPERVAVGELRATAGDVATVAVDESDASALSADRSYRLLTLPTRPRADRAFATLLRGADETMAVVDVDAGSDLAGGTLSAVGATVVAVRGPGGDVETLPSRDRTLAPGDALYVVARPDLLRRLEDAAAGDGADAAPAGSQPS
jgi:hypothetical protein